VDTASIVGLWAFEGLKICHLDFYGQNRNLYIQKVILSCALAFGGLPLIKRFSRNYKMEVAYG
jgi:hypothetical protein